MSEKLTHHSNEHIQDNPENQHEYSKTAEQIQNRIETNQDEKNHESLEALTAKVESLAQDNQEKLKTNHHEGLHLKQHPLHVNKQLKDMAYSRTLTRIQKKLPLASRTFSKIVHNPVVDSVSSVAEKTIARPSSMLGGAIFSLFGTSTVLFITKRLGYEFNYTIAILTFLIGAFVGLTIEMLYKSYRKIKQ